MTNGTERVRITSGDGIVGIGVTDPKAHIHTHIASSGGAYHQFTNSSTNANSDDGWKIGIHDDENFIIWGQESTEMFAIYNNGAYRFYVDHNGSTVIPQNGKLIVSGEEGSFSAGSHNGHEINPNGVGSVLFRLIRTLPTFWAERMFVLIISCFHLSIRR